MFITPTSLTVTQLLGSQNEQYSIPAYQRRYSWHEKQLVELIDDISLIEGSDTHLLGSIVCLTGHHVAGINKLELVDGQQRITTISILLHCILDRLRADNENSEAQDIERLLQSKALGGLPTRKIALDTLDAFEFDQLAARNELERPSNFNLAAAFQIFRKWVSEQTLAQLGTFLYRLKNQAIVIRLDVSDAKDAFKLFETINNRGLKLSPTDIIKNFILGNAARFGPPSLELARRKWAEVIGNLDGTNFEAFFRHFLCAQLRRRITISYVISNFKRLFMKTVEEAETLPDRRWYDDEAEDDLVEDENETAPPEGGDDTRDDIRGLEQIPFATFLDRLAKSAKVYGQIVHARAGVPKVDRHLRNLRMIKSLQTYGFLMALRVGGCSDDQFTKVLQLTEAFLLRRHICRERSNDNERLFARLCGIDPANPLPELIAEYRQMCPSDEKFKQEFSAFEFSANLIDRARYCLEQFEIQRHGGRHQELFVGGPDTVHVEHVIPLKIKTKKAKDEFGDWVAYLGPGAETKHPRYVSRIGNLTLFAGPLNIGASNNPYERKKSAYNGSTLRLTNTLPSEYAEFKFDAVHNRSSSLADVAVELWPMT
jgi:Protein of unknown function DUF262/Protein of unknown function (DUF1524)